MHLRSEVGREVFGALPHFDIRHNLSGRVVSYRRLPHFTPNTLPWYWKLSGPQGCWMPTEGTGHLKIFKDPDGNRTRNILITIVFFTNLMQKFFILIHLLYSSCWTRWLHYFYTILSWWSYKDVLILLVLQYKVLYFVNRASWYGGPR